MATILERREFRLLPDEDLGFAKPVLEVELPDGSLKIVRPYKYSAPEPELARAKNDPGYWTLQVWLPLGSTPRRMIADPDGPTL